MKLLLLIIITFFIVVLAKKLIYSLLIHSKAMTKNYQNQDVPIGFGILFPMASIASLTIFNFLHPLDAMAYTFLLGITSISFLGAIDDLLGSRETTGLKGHIGKLLKLELTTGGLKAVMGIIIGCLVTMPMENNIILLILKTLIIALFTNFLNLLDLRPGRAIKGYLLYTVLLLLLFFRENSIYMLIMITTMVILYFPLDLKAKAMMGDAGSNVLGFTLGFYTILYGDILMNVIIFILLILIHIIAEKSSITKVIENNTLLNFLDQWGR